MSRGDDVLRAAMTTKDQLYSGEHLLFIYLIFRKCFLSGLLLTSVETAEGKLLLKNVIWIYFFLLF